MSWDVSIYTKLGNVWKIQNSTLWLIPEDNFR
jgi:hypothetical protein